MVLTTGIFSFYTIILHVYHNRPQSFKYHLWAYDAKIHLSNSEPSLMLRFIGILCLLYIFTWRPYRVCPQTLHGPN